jgi:protein-arginine kinase activator protein McsA
MLATKVKCDRCDEPAVMHATEVQEGQIVETHLCRAHGRDLPFMPQSRNGFPPLAVKKDRYKSGDLVCDTCGAPMDVLVHEWVNPRKIRSKRGLCASCARSEGLEFQSVQPDELAVVIEGWSDSLEWDEEP